ncbi:hypothetical protein HY312_02490 [Candidatus Saccharibacteria bacterium]|nr:hypothetical protein [Candidatus Saccharibacteria bacterium]
MTKKFLIRFAAVLFIVVGLSIAAIAAFKSTDKVDQNLVFADRTLLSGLWDSYKKEYWEESTGRTLDKQQNDITTSEGQSYTMMRAVWQGDQTTFDKSWAWTKEQLRRDDNLFAWRWGQKADGTYGVLTDQGGQNSASDADSDISLALMMAASKWQSKTYLDEAKKIIPSIWEEEVITVAGKPYLASNNLEKDSQQDAIINPSYISPYAYRLFAKVDKENDWMGLVDSSYELLNKSIDDNLDKTESANLPPDWIAMNKQTGVIGAIAGNANLTTNYSFDAMRTPWRLALDYKWYNEPRAKETLSKMSFLNKQWEDTGKIYSTYSHDGKTVKTDEVAEGYATALAYFAVVKPDVAKDIYDKKLKTLYDQNTNSWSQDMTYYGDNWAWLGIALYDNKLDNLAEKLN